MRLTPVTGETPKINDARLSAAAEANHQNSLPGHPEQVEPSTVTLALLFFVSSALFVTVICLFQDYFVRVDEFGDNASYIAIASAIRNWTFQDVYLKHFWGLPYVMATISVLTGASDRVALLLLSFAASFASLIMAARLWGGWVASYFAVINFDWLQRSFLGGAEPLFLCLLLGAFLAARRGNWLLAMLFASLSTLVRPLGLLAVISIGILLLSRREIQKVALAFVIGLTVCGLYVLPLITYFGDGLANLAGYQADWDHGFPIGWPFLAIVKGTLLHPVPWTNLLLTYTWIVLLGGAAVIAMVAPRFHRFAQAHPVEILFAAMYLAFLFTYNSPYWARATFPRMSIPVLPFVLIALYPMIPKRREVIWTFAIASPILAAGSAVGIRNVIGQFFP